VLEPLRRQVRDLARGLRREVALELTGGETEVDRAVLDQIRAPLTHLIRNAVDHGIEGPEERAAAGKPPEGTIRVAAAERGGRLVLSVADDGRGLAAAAVRAATCAPHPHTCTHNT